MPSILERNLAERNAHDLAALDGFDRVLTINEGRVVFDGDPTGAVAAYLQAMQ